MNNSFIKDDVEIPSISRRDLLIITIGSIVSGSVGLFFVSPIHSSFEFASLLNSSAVVAIAFVIGLFSFLTAGLLFSSHNSRLYLLRRINEVGAKRAFQIRVLLTLMITSVFTIVFTIIAFLRPILLNSPINTNHFTFIPSVLGASLIGSVSLAAIASSLAVITDDSRICATLGCASTYVIAMVAGFQATPGAWQYSLTRNLALLSPHNIVRALAVQLSGYQFESTYEMVRWVGFTVSGEGLSVALLILGLIAIIPLLVGQRILSKNSARWTVLEGMIPDRGIWPTSVSAEKLQEINRIRRGLRIQRGLTTVIVAGLLISMFAGISMYSISIANSTTFVHYSSPADEERIPVGSWIVINVEVRPPYPGLFNDLHFRCDVDSWGNASKTLSFYFGSLEMSSTEFDMLNESSRLELVSSRLNRTFDGGFGFGRETNLRESYGSYVCVLKVVSVANPLENSYIDVELFIIQRAI